MLNRIQVRWLTWPLHNSPLLSLQKLFGCFCSMLWVIVHLHCEAPSMSSEAFGWIWADNIARNTSEFILLLLSVVTSSINTREPVPLAAIHAHATTTMLHWWGSMLRIMSSSLPSQFWNNILWTDETKINLYQSDGKRRVWRRKGAAHDPKHTTSSVKHGGGSVMAWACMAASGTGSLVFIDDVTADKSSRMNSEVFRAILSAHIQPNASELIGRRFTVQMDNDPKHTAKATKEFLKGKKCTVMQWPSQSPDLNPIEHAFHLLKTKLKGKCPKNKQELKTVAVEAWQSITRDETQRLVMSMRSRLQAVIDCKGFATKY